MSKCLDESILLESSNTTINDSGTDDIFDYDEDPDAGVDILYEDPIFASDQIVLCQLCGLHSSCFDNEVEGANMTAFDACTEAGCCGSAPEGFPVSNDTPPAYAY